MSAIRLCRQRKPHETKTKLNHNKASQTGKPNVSKSNQVKRTKTKLNQTHIKPTEPNPHQTTQTETLTLQPPSALTFRPSLASGALPSF